jgi:NHLM bacteriocin system ABC transporter ATP-binding protein
MTEPFGGQAARTPRLTARGPTLHERVPLVARRPILLDNPTRALRIVSGHADVFAVPIVNGVPAGARRHLYRTEAGGIILGWPFAGSDKQGQMVGALAVGGQGAEALVLERTLLDEDREALEAWIAALASAVVEKEAAWNARAVEPDTVVDLEAGQQFRVAAHDVAWVTVDVGEIALMGGASVCCAGDLPMPFASRMWGEARGNARVRIINGKKIFSANPWPAIDQFHGFAMRHIAGRFVMARESESQRLRDRIRRAASQGGQLVSELASVLVPEQKSGFWVDGADPLLDACSIVARAIGARVIAPPSRDPSKRGIADAADIAQVSHLRSRRVLLRADWWERNAGPLVAWRGKALEPIALIPISPRRYVLVEPGKDAGRRVDAKVAAELAPEAIMFYAPMPAAVNGSAASLVGICLRHGSSDLARIILSALAIGLIGLATPLITEILFDSVIPRTEWNQLAYCAAALALVAIGVAAFRTVQSVAILRLEGVLDSILQPGIVDRLLRLPVSFFRTFSAGDLTDRALGIEAIRRIAAGHTIQGLVAGVFSLFSFALMFYYSVSLALIAIALTLLRGAMIALTCGIRLGYERQHFELDGKAQGLVVQLITGVSKLRVAFATRRALGVWGRIFADQKRQFVASQRTANLLNVFEAAFPTVATIIIFARTVHGVELDSGQFLAFFVAFGQSLEAVGQLASALGATLIGIPRIDRLRPLIAEPLEIDEARNPPGDLTGAIDLEQVAFRYIPGGPTILDKLTMKVGRGEYLAVVGPSGSGKSTLFRLLLGFEKPESGTIFFDGKAIDSLDITAVRRQLGVILQNGKLTSGSLYENICGGTQLPLERAWEAARLAGLAGDIEAMPMGMHTVIAEGTSTLSGGQRQRLMIARALVHRPRILLFDEATSALDNRTQATVNGSLAKLNVTRIVIAQRLSTVRNADRIVVLAGGKIVQSGSFTELVAEPGLFAEIARRQLL